MQQLSGLCVIYAAVGGLVNTMTLLDLRCYVPSVSSGFYFPWYRRIHACRDLIVGSGWLVGSYHCGNICRL